MNAQDFLAELKHVVLGHPVMSHDMFVEMDMGHVSLDQLKTFTVYYYHHVLRTRLYDAAALAYAPTERLQMALAEILWDEYGHGKERYTHPEQFRLILRALDIKIPKADAEARLPEQEEYSRIHYGLCSPETPWKAIGAVGFAMEWPVPFLYESMVRAYRKIAGLTDADLEFLLEHIPTDEEHSELMIKTVGPHLQDMWVQDQVLEGAITSMDARETLMESIWQRMHATSNLLETRMAV